MLSITVCCTMLVQGRVAQCVCVCVCPTGAAAHASRMVHIEYVDEQTRVGAGLTGALPGAAGHGSRARMAGRHAQGRETATEKGAQTCGSLVQTGHGIAQSNCTCDCLLGRSLVVHAGTCADVRVRVRACVCVCVCVCPCRYTVGTIGLWAHISRIRQAYPPPTRLKCAQRSHACLRCHRALTSRAHAAGRSMRPL